jgi:hypothetical protein
MSTRVSELDVLLAKDDLADQITYLWSHYYSERHVLTEEWKEQRNFVFATDTSSTSNRDLPWSNTTTLPKLCQIRDNLHSNYLSALYPNDRWLRWEGYSQQDSVKAKREAVEAYMENKTRESNFRDTLSQLLYDYIDYGNAFCTTSYESISYEVDGEEVPQYIGPRMNRISPMDIVFDPTAQAFDKTWKVVRSVKTVGELKKQAEDEPENQYLAAAMAKRDTISKFIGIHGVEDSDKADGFQVDGFGSMLEYFNSGYVELLEFWGDMHDPDTGVTKNNRVITIIDRSFVIRDEPIPNWFGTAPIFHVGWRKRPDNLWAMGPLANLVGMQYKIDSYENAKADAIDLAVLPPLVVAGEVEEFDYRPAAEITMDEGGTITELGRNLQGVISAANEIQALEMRMEMYAGAPREAMGIRSAGEKTAFEVQQLQNAAGRIFQEKVTTFEISLLEPALNSMLETARRHLDTTDVVRVMDDDVGVNAFISVTKDDITAKGKIRPVGARHFAANAQLLQNLNGIFASPVGQMVATHTSTKNLAKLLEGVMGLTRFDLFRPNVAVEEQMETQQLAAQMQEDEAATLAASMGQQPEQGGQMPDQGNLPI